MTPEEQAHVTKLEDAHNKAVNAYEQSGDINDLIAVGDAFYALENDQQARIARRKELLDNLNKITANLK